MLKQGSFRSVTKHFATLFVQYRRDKNAQPLSDFMDKNLPALFDDQNIAKLLAHKSLNFYWEALLSNRKPYVNHSVLGVYEIEPQKTLSPLDLLKGWYYSDCAFDADNDAEFERYFALAKRHGNYKALKYQVDIDLNDLESSELHTQEYITCFTNLCKTAARIAELHGSLGFYHAAEIYYQALTQCAGNSDNQMQTFALAFSLLEALLNAKKHQDTSNAAIKNAITMQCIDSIEDIDAEMETIKTQLLNSGLLKQNDVSYCYQKVHGNNNSTTHFSTRCGNKL